MRIFRHYDDLPKSILQAVVAIGNFDGVHIGHKKLINKASNLAKANNLPCVVLSFEPHPNNLFKIQEEAFRLTPLRSKAHELDKLGLDALIVLKFNKTFAQIPAKNFVLDVLVNGLKAKHIVAGYDFVFGHNRGGNCDLLFKLGNVHGFNFIAVNQVKNSINEIYSSTNIRKLIKLGDLSKARDMLGRDFSILGRVAHGKKLGRNLGFPTANIHLSNSIRPKFGVYAVRIEFLDSKTNQLADGVANIGRRPTVNGDGEILEVFIFDFDQDIYMQKIKISLVEFIRTEVKFEKLETMVIAMKHDAEVAKSILAIK